MNLQFEVKFFAKNDDSEVEFKRIVKRVLKKILKIEENSIVLEEKAEEEVFHDLFSKICRFNGTVRRDVVDKSLLFDLIMAYCGYELAGSLINFNPTIYDEFDVFKAKLKTRNEISLSCINMGTILKLNSFIPHIKFGKTKHCSVQLTSLKANFEHDKNRLLLELFESDHHEFVLKYSSIKYIVLSYEEPFAWSIYLILSLPPLLYEVKKDDVEGGGTQATELSREKTNADSDNEEATVTYSKNVTHLRKTSFAGFNAKVIAKSNVIHLSVSGNQNGKKRKPEWNKIWSIVRNVNRYAKTPVYVGRISIVSDCVGDVELPMPTRVPFDIIYAMKCLDNLSYQLYDELYQEYKGNRFIVKVEELSSRDSKATVEALYDLFWILDFGIPVDSLYILDTLFRNKKIYSIHQKKYEYITEVRRCIVTPSRLLLLPPLPYLKSRFFRNSDPEFALRVYAKDDDLDSLSFTVCKRGDPTHQKEFLRNFLLVTLSFQINIGERCYKFVGSSTSQLREVGMLFYAEDYKKRTAASLRESIGDLNHIKNPAKYVARIGLAFSQPIAYVKEVPSSSVTVQQDIIGGFHPITKKPYVFSDGIGMISEELAEDITALIAKDRLVPYSAYQIRYGGCKGMLAINPQLNRKDVILRDSMKKYESSSVSLEVLKVSEPRPLYLNKPFINILEQLGVENAVIMSFARDCLRRIIDSYNCGCKALEAIKSHSSLKLNYDLLQNSEIDVLVEPFFRGILEIVAKHTIKMMKSKARIKLPLEYGRIMFGVLDESGILKPGEVFVQYSKIDDYFDREVVTGDVLVSKFPCMHPGDVRKFKAVNVQLYHICDCIVFPQKGSRPHPDEMAGSDLDGDEFAVIWHEPLLFPGNNQNAMDYPEGGSSSNEKDDVSVLDMLGFYVDYLQHDEVGIIANSHLALSDQLSNGIFHEHCIDLAEKYAIALDYAKTGETIKNDPKLRPQKYPDYMEKSDSKPTYRSERVLGKLYRLCCMFEENIEFQGFLDNQSCENDLLLEFPYWCEYEKDAIAAYQKYKIKILHIQKQYGIEDELSLLSGIYSKMQKYVCGKNERNDVQEMIASFVSDIVKELRHDFFEDICEVDEYRKQQIYKSKASAWYLVTRAINQKSKIKYYGLPWIVSDILCGVANFKSNVPNAVHICKLNKEIIAEDISELRASLCNLSFVDIHVNIEHLFRRWLTNNLESFKGFYDTISDGDAYEKFVAPVVNEVMKEVEYKRRSVEFITEKILRALSTNDKSSDELQNILGLAALMTLNRYRRTKQFSEISNRPESTEKGIVTICLSMQMPRFRKYVKNEQRQFCEQLKLSGVEEVRCQVYESKMLQKGLKDKFFGFLYVTAIGTQKSLKRLKNALTKDSFYIDIFNNVIYD